MPQPKLSAEFAHHFDLVLLPDKQGLNCAIIYHGEVVGFETLNVAGNVSEIREIFSLSPFAWLKWNYRAVCYLSESTAYTLIPEEFFRNEWQQTWLQLSFQHGSLGKLRNFKIGDQKIEVITSHDAELLSLFESLYPSVFALPLALALLAWAEPGHDSAVVLPQRDGLHLAVMEAGETAMLKFVPVNSGDEAIEKLIETVQAAMLAPPATALHILPVNEARFAGFTVKAQQFFKSVSAPAINPDESSLQRLLVEKFAATFL